MEQRNLDQPHNTFYAESGLGFGMDDDEGGWDRSRLTPLHGPPASNDPSNELSHIPNQPFIGQPALLPGSIASWSTDSTHGLSTHQQDSLRSTILDADRTTVSGTNITLSSNGDEWAAPTHPTNLYLPFQSSNPYIDSHPSMFPSPSDFHLPTRSQTREEMSASRIVSKRTRKRTNSTFSDDGTPGERPAIKQPKLTASYCIGADDDQEATLHHFLTKWKKRDHLPNEKECRMVAQATKLSLTKVALWYGDRLTILQSERHEKRIDSWSRPDAEVVHDVERYIERRRGRNCTSTHALRGRGGKYRCTWGCGYSTDYRNAWERHEEKRQPQRFWHCVSCRAKRKKGNDIVAYLSCRFDKFLVHAEVCAPQEDPQDLRARSEVLTYEGPFVQRCNYVDPATGFRCSRFLGTWRERNDHYIRHFEDEAEAQDCPHGGSDHDLPDDDDDDVDNDDDEDGDDDWGNGQDGSFVQRPSGTTHGNATGGRQSVPGNWMALRNDQSHLAFSTNAERRLDALCGRERPHESVSSDGTLGCDRPSASAPIDDYHSEGTVAMWLIDIDNYCMTKAQSGLRFLALKYSAPQGPSLACLQHSRAASRPTLPPSNELPCLFQKAIGLAKDLGFQYLWIDIFCGLRSGDEKLDSIYKEANLILVMGHPSSCTSQVWHFWCDYSHLNTVQTWAKQSVSFHHLKQLGHGAYSVVDQVQLQPTAETYARKIVFRTHSKKALATRYVQEITIMQKFDHPHLAQFVAAYYDNSAFNILISPVADCDLRIFLACPDRFSQKRKHLSTWFMSLAEALARMHKEECRHKDIKPANILINGNNVLLADFGTSLDFSTNVSTSNGGAQMTPKYCAPEVAAKDDRGRSADVFSMGAVFAEMITVDLGKTLEDMDAWIGMEQDASDRLATYHNHLSDVARWLEMLMMTQHPTSHQERVISTAISMLAKDPASRPTASAVIQALCQKKNCTGLRADATCHCCPRRGSADLPSNTGLSGVPTKTSVSGMPLTREKTTHTAFPYDQPAWAIQGRLTKYCADRIGFSFDFRSRDYKISFGYPLRKPIQFYNIMCYLLWSTAIPGWDIPSTYGRGCRTQPVSAAGFDAGHRGRKSSKNAVVQMTNHASSGSCEGNPSVRQRSFSESDVQSLRYFIQHLHLEI